MGNCLTVVDGNNQIWRTSRRSSRKSVYPITAADGPDVLQKSASKSEEAKESNADATAKENVVQRLKILVSAKEYNELLSQGHSRESIRLLLGQKMEVQGSNSRRRVRVNYREDKKVSSWRPSLEAIPEY